MDASDASPVDALATDRDYLGAQFTDADDRLHDLEQLALFAGKYESLSSFLSEVSLQEGFGQAADEQQPGNQDRIILSTIHQAKGLEWQAVFILHLSDAYFPNPRALTEDGGMEEERRLFYVAVTRAREQLFMTYSLAAGFRSASMQVQSPSPFLKEIPDRLLEAYRLTEQQTVLEDSLIDPDSIIDLDDDQQPRGLLDRVLRSNEQKRSARRPSR
jgi:DNA helicase-2/ATP-dependent DNA helicase PcrA